MSDSLEKGLASDQSSLEIAGSDIALSLLQRAESSEGALHAVLGELSSCRREVLLALAARLFLERSRDPSAEVVRELTAEVHRQRALIHELEALSDDAQLEQMSAQSNEERVEELEEEHEDLRQRLADVLGEELVDEGLSLRDGVELLLEEVRKLRTARDSLLNG